MGGYCFFNAVLCLAANVLMIQAAKTHYTLVVKTGLALAAGTDAIVEIRLGADSGNYSTIIPLENNKNNFEHAATDHFTLKTNYLGAICQVTVWKIDRGYFADWELDQMVLFDNVTKGKSVFKFNKWMGAVENSTAKIDGDWGPWSPWSVCSRKCGSGQRVRARKCDRPPPACGGQSCNGRKKQTSDCHQTQCTTTTIAIKTTATTTAATTTTTLPRTISSLPNTTTLPVLKTTSVLAKTPTLLKTPTLPKTTTPLSKTPTTFVKTTTALGKSTFPRTTTTSKETITIAPFASSIKPTRASKVPVVYANSKDGGQDQVSIRFRLTLPPLPEVSTRRPTRRPPWYRRPPPRPKHRSTYRPRLRYPVEHRNPYPRPSTVPPSTSTTQSSTTLKSLITDLTSSSRTFNSAKTLSSSIETSRSPVLYQRRTKSSAQSSSGSSRTYQPTTTANYRMNIASRTDHIEEKWHTTTVPQTSPASQPPYQSQHVNAVLLDTTSDPVNDSRKSLAQHKISRIRPSKDNGSSPILTTQVRSTKQQTTEHPTSKPVKGENPKLKSELSTTTGEELGVTIRSRVVQKDSPAYKSFPSTRSNELPPERNAREENRSHLSVYVIVAICVSGVVVISVIIVVIYCAVVKSKIVASPMSPPTISLQPSSASPPQVSYPMTVQCLPR